MFLMIMKATRAAKLSQQFKNKNSLTNEHNQIWKATDKEKVEMKPSRFYYFMFLSKMDLYVFLINTSSHCCIMFFLFLPLFCMPSLF